MTLSVRNSILRISLVSILAAMGAAAVLLLRAERPLPTAEALGMLQRHRWLVFGWTTAGGSVAWIVIGLFLVAAFVFIGTLIMVRYFRKTTAPEMLFFILFVLAAGFDIWKVGHVVLHLEPLPIYFAVLLTRLVHFAHLFGVFSLFVSTLYLAGIEYQKTGTALGLAALLAMTIIYAIPVDHLTLNPNLVHKVGDESTIQSVMLILQLLSVANVVYAITYERHDEYLQLLPAVIAVIVGRELIFYLPSLPAALVGLVLLMGGVAVFASRLHVIYLWK